MIPLLGNSQVYDQATNIKVSISTNSLFLVLWIQLILLSFLEKRRRFFQVLFVRYANRGVAYWNLATYGNLLVFISPSALCKMNQNTINYPCAQSYLIGSLVFTKTHWLAICLLFYQGLDVFNGQTSCYMTDMDLVASILDGVIFILFCSCWRSIRKYCWCDTYYIPQPLQNLKIHTY